MVKCHICINMLQQIIDLQKSSNVPYDEVKALWQEFYFYLQKNRRRLILELWGTDGMHYFYLLDKALSQPLYHDEKEHILDISHDDTDYSQYSYFVKEDRENFIKQAMGVAIQYLEDEYQIREKNSSLYQCCSVSSEKIASRLQSSGSTARVVDVRKVFPTAITHKFCYATFVGDDGKIHPYIIDMTYRQMYIFANCIPESRHLITEDALFPFPRKYSRHYIAPGLFAEMENPEKLDALLQKGFFQDCSSLEMYGNSFYQAELSKKSEDLSSLQMQRKSGEEYYDVLKKKLGGK